MSRKEKKTKQRKTKQNKKKREKEKRKRLLHGPKNIFENPLIYIYIYIQLSINQFLPCT